MISDKYFKFIHIFVTVGYYTRLLPWRWDKTRNRLIPLSSEKDYHLFQWNIIFQICLRVVGIAYLIITILIIDLPYYEVILAVFLIITWFQTSIVLFLLLLNRMELQNLFNCCFLLNEQQSKNFRLKFK